MYFIIKIEDLKKVNIAEFCKKKKYDQDMIVQGSDILIRIKNGQVELPIKITEGKGPKYTFEESTMEEIFSPCFSSIECEMKEEEELLLALDLARYIASCTNMVLYDGFEKYITGERINSMEEEDINLWIEETKILLKYYYKIRSITEKRDSINVIFFTAPYTISLIFFSIVASLLVIYMILGLKITNGFLIALPLVLAVGIHLIVPIKNIVAVSKLSKKLWQATYDRVIEISKLYNLVIPKKPSITKKQKNIKQTITDGVGISIIPAIIIGSILMAVDHIVLGIVIFALPWTVLIGIKVLVTDKENNNLEKVVLELTNKLWALEDDYVGIKYEIIEKRNYNWIIKIKLYKQVDINTINKLDTKNELVEIKELSGKAKCNCRWEEVQDRVGATILRKIVNTD